MKLLCAVSTCKLHLLSRRRYRHRIVNGDVDGGDGSDDGGNTSFCLIDTGNFHRGFLLYSNLSNINFYSIFTFPTTSRRAIFSIAFYSVFGSCACLRLAPLLLEQLTICLKLKLISFLFSAFFFAFAANMPSVLCCVQCAFMMLFALFASRQHWLLCLEYITEFVSQPNFFRLPFSSFPILFFIIYSHFPVMFRIEYHFLSFFWATCILRAFRMRLLFTDWMSVLMSVHFVRLEAFTKRRCSKCSFSFFFFALQSAAKV